MATTGDRGKAAGANCINEVLTDDELRAVLSKLQTEEERDKFGLVCKRWLHLQSSERRRLRARAGPAMLRRMAERFSGVVEMDLSQSTSRSFYPGIADSDLSVVAARFWRLVSLDLQNCKGISDAGIIALGKGLPSLQALDVSGCKKLTDQGLAAIAVGCPKLRRLHLSGCKLATDELLRALSRNCPRLQDLGLSGCQNITDSGLSTLIDGCRHLRFLDLSRCNKVGDEGICRIVRSCSSSLETLKLQDCINISEKSVHAMADYSPNLETIVLGGCRNVTEESVKALITACCSSIKNLRVDWCPDIGDSSLLFILSKCRSLSALDISCCDKVTDAAFNGLAAVDFASRLKVFKASSCPRITVNGLGMLLAFGKSLEHVDVSSCPHITKAGCDQAGLTFPAGCKTYFSSSLPGADAIVDLFF